MNEINEQMRTTALVFQSLESRVFSSRFEEVIIGSVSELGPRVAQRAQVAEVATY